MAYRTAGDLDEFAETERVRWTVIALPVVRHDKLPEGADANAVDETLRTAFSSWVRPECGAPVIDYKGTTNDFAKPDDGANTIEWVTEGWVDRGFETGAGAFTDLGYARLDGGDWEIVEADLYVNADEFDWSDGGVNDAGFSLESLVIHEAGHMLGLLHPCEIEAGLGAPVCDEHPEMSDFAMHPLYDATRLELQEDDVAGLCFLYGADAPTTDPLDSPLNCEDDGVCPRGMQCEEGRCAGGTGLPGDPCSSHADCHSRTCGEDGACAAPCVVDDDCEGEETCESVDEFGGRCSAETRFGLGTECQDSSECLGGQCVDADPGRQFCSRLCDEQECPDQWVCEVVEERAVCVPFLPDVSGGCAVVPAPTEVPSSRDSTAGAIVMLVSVGLAAGRSARRRRDERTDS